MSTKSDLITSSVSSLTARVFCWRQLGGSLSCFPGLKLKTSIPSHLAGVICASLLNLVNLGCDARNIGSIFYPLPDGSQNYLVVLTLSTRFCLAIATARPLLNRCKLNWDLFVNLLPSALLLQCWALSNLCSVLVLDGMTGKRHSANSGASRAGLKSNIICAFLWRDYRNGGYLRSMRKCESRRTVACAAMIILWSFSLAWFCLRHR